MGDKNQQEVWAEVRKSAQSINPGSRVGGALGGIVAMAPPSSYARAMASPAAQSKVEAVAAPLEQSYGKVMRELRERRAVGVVVAVNGEIIWADIFASTSLLEKYWPKLVRSYAAEAVTITVSSNRAVLKWAQAFIDDRVGKREVVESEPGVYRHVEIAGNGYRVFELASLLPNALFDVHIAKMSELRNRGACGRKAKVKWQKANAKSERLGCGKKCVAETDFGTSSVQLKTAHNPPLTLLGCASTCTEEPEIAIGGWGEQ